MAREGRVVSLAKLCRWLGSPRRSLYYWPKARSRVVNTELTAWVKLTLERFPCYGYRRLACVLGENRKTIGPRMIMGLHGPQMIQGYRPVIRGIRSQSFSVDLCAERGH